MSGLPAADDDDDDDNATDGSEDGGSCANVQLPPGVDDVVQGGDATATPPAAAAAAAAADGGDESGDPPPPPPPPRALAGRGTVWGTGLDWEGARLDAAWLRAFIATRGGGFEADAGYHVGRTFLKALLAQPPVIVSAPPGAGAAGGASPTDGSAVAADGTAAAAAEATGAAALSGESTGRPDALPSARRATQEDPPVNGGVERDVEDAAEAAAAGAATRGGFHMVDTRRLAQAVLTERLAVAAEWKAALARVPAAHAALRRELLQKSLDASA